MGKRRAEAAKDALVTGIIDDVRFDRADALVMIGIPSHDRHNKALAKGMQSRWATAAMRLFADLFTGASAIRTYKGIYKSQETREYLWDDTIIIESFASPDAIQDEKIVYEVVKFARRMRSALNQEAVFLVFNNVVRFVVATR